MDSQLPFDDHPLLRGVDRHQLESSGISPVSLAPKEVIFDTDDQIDRVWFIDRGLVNLVSIVRSADGEEEDADGITVGFGGCVGLPVALGSQRAITRAVAHTKVDAFVLEGEALRQLLSVNSAFNKTIMLYYEAIFAQVVQAMLCNARHSIEQRFCRTMLTIRHQCRDDTLPLTQAFVARHLGVDRTSLVPLYRKLQDAEIIAVYHGRVRVLDVDAVQRLSCSCYQRITERFLQIAGSSI